MALHLIKMCVGCDTIRDLESWIDEWHLLMRRLGREIDYHHTTRHFPKRTPEILAGGSLYWVMKRQVTARQTIRAVEQVVDEGGISRCHLMLEKQVIPVEPRPYRPFQGWRYLSHGDAPPDLTERTRAIATMPQTMRAELVHLGLL